MYWMCESAFPSKHCRHLYKLLEGDLPVSYFLSVFRAIYLKGGVSPIKALVVYSRLGTQKTDFRVHNLTKLEIEEQVISGWTSFHCLLTALACMLLTLHMLCQFLSTLFGLFHTGKRLCITQHGSNCLIRECGLMSTKVMRFNRQTHTDRPDAGGTATCSKSIHLRWCRLDEGWSLWRRHMGIQLVSGMLQI